MAVKVKNCQWFYIVEHCPCKMDLSRLAMRTEDEEEWGRLRVLTGVPWAEEGREEDEVVF
jgi:hypothetical protein